MDGGADYNADLDAADVVAHVARVVPQLPCSADLDGDGFVGVSDLVLLILAFGCAGCPEDLDGDGIVGVADLIQLILDWGPC